MNNQVLIDRELLAEYLSGHGEDWVEAGHKLREILDATPAPIPDAGGEVLTPALRQYLHNDGSGLVAGYDLELTQRIVSALQASAMVVPDGYKLVPIEPTAAMFKAAKGSGVIDPRVSGYCYQLMLAASTTPGDSQ